jgi:hypothetical protein
MSNDCRPLEIRIQVEVYDRDRPKYPGFWNELNKRHEISQPGSQVNIILLCVFGVSALVFRACGLAEEDIKCKCPWPILLLKKSSTMISVRIFSLRLEKESTESIP